MAIVPSDRPLRTLQVSMRDRFGERFNGYGLHRALRERGHASRMTVLYRTSGDADVDDFGAGGRLLERGLLAVERMTGWQGHASPLGARLARRAGFRDADLVHWHLIYPHFIALRDLPGLAAARATVWTLHDPWALTGHCVHPMACERWRTGCGACPDLGRSFPVWVDRTAEVWRAKAEAYRRAPFEVIVSTRWMQARVEASPLLRDHRCHRIPFGIDLARWPRPDRGAVRAALGLAPSDRAIAFRVPKSRYQREAKGVPWLVEALERSSLPTSTALLVMDDTGQLDALRGRFRVIETGWIASETRLAEVLTAADVFVMPSLAESFGFMVLEAMACGTPVVATAGTPMEDTVGGPEHGRVVPPRDAAALARAIEDLVSEESRRVETGRRARARVEAEFGFDRYVERHLELYRELGARHRAAKAT